MLLNFSTLEIALVKLNLVPVNLETNKFVFALTYVMKNNCTVIWTKTIFMYLILLASF